MKLLVLYFFFFLSFCHVHGQISGLSGSKLSAVSADVIPSKTIEFEPGFSISKHSRYWDHQSVLCDVFSNSDSVHVHGEFHLRTTYGVTDGLEVGVSVPVNMKAVHLGMKYQMSRTDRLGIAFLGGLNTSFAGAPMKSDEVYTMVGLGSVVSLFLSDDFSMDADLQFLSAINKLPGQYRQSTFVNVEAGQYFFEQQLLAVFGLGYHYHAASSHYAHLFTLMPGFSVETGRNFAITISSPVAVWGKNHEQSFGVNFALTFVMN